MLDVAATIAVVIIALVVLDIVVAIAVVVCAVVALSQKNEMKTAIVVVISSLSVKRFARDCRFVVTHSHWTHFDRIG